MYQSDAYKAGMMRSNISSYGLTIRSSVDELPDIRMAAQQRRNHAMESLKTLGPRAIMLVEAVAVDGKSAGKYFMQEGHGYPNDGLVLLVKAAHVLARHYGFIR